VALQDHQMGASAAECGRGRTERVIMREEIVCPTGPRSRSSGVRQRPEVAGNAPI
jgi:hypothetical protein